MKEYYLDRKEFSSFCFCWWKPLLKLERIKFLKNNLIFLLMEIIGGIQFLKVTLFWQMETVLELSFCQWKPLQKLDEIQFLENTSVRGSLFVVGKTNFQASGNHFFLHFVETPVSFFRLEEKYFSKKFFILAGGNGFAVQWKPFSFAQSFSSKWKPSSKLTEGNF